MADGSGKRDNDCKIRYDLIPSFAQEQYAKVLTFGAIKYGDNNWKKGMPWSTILSSLERHLEAIKKGEDYDKESGFLHIAHVMCNAGFLTEYYNIYPQGDDRNLPFLTVPNIAICMSGIMYNSISKDELKNINVNDIKFCEKAKADFADLTFFPKYYISELNDNIVSQWLKTLNFPEADIISWEKFYEMKDQVDIVISDDINILKKLSKDKIFCYLLDAPHNRNIDVGHRRIKNIKDIVA